MKKDDDMQIEPIRGDVLTQARKSRGDVEIHESKDRGGIEFRTAQVPIDFYLRRNQITEREYHAAARLYRDFYISGQLMGSTINLSAVRGDDQRAYLPVSEMQREALDNWRKAIDSIHGKIGRLMILNVCCYGNWLKDIKYSPYKDKQSMPRFREALADLVAFYDSLKKSIDRR